MDGSRQGDGHNGPSNLIAYFGYGSLVNRATLRTDYVAAQPVRLMGWRRCWRPRHAQDPIDSGHVTSLLSARQVEGSVIDGLLIYDRLDNLPSVDEREMTYDRVAVPIERLDMAGGELPDCPVYVYEAQTNTADHDPHHPILQSYLDAVLQGFLREFGRQGVHDFLETTDGFERHVHADRQDPVYPRAVRLIEEERSFIDGILEERGIRFLDPPRREP
ncbi:gamma-glutamylcyclotransferase family protein [Hoeflea prorocentri]|uniref:Gamma-glutamylcyclotransferase n=1 Tax=Hoeflea prorocentri TaxID=1922333 RepID=A0A9X3UGI7_9HYPH|nr:gamma-glutamylcyclotransferase family protein [Hoeflea prorocentri]MCY6380302.1 gamma-glutamylcyclotransferase [Hoeflea prorocentri]MDA5398102.1 gamma-glutamylcyclotransferase [Hoeflea prorocentri]